MIEWCHNMTPLGEKVMKKEERLIQEMIYVNARKKFNLHDLMTKFSISKSTALRDIDSLEQIGVPLYSEKGLYGGYVILENQLLPPIYFNDNELYSLFFSLQLLKTVLETPFEKNYQEIKEKLFAVLSETQKEKITAADPLIQFVGTNQKKHAPFLNELFLALFQHKVIEIFYARYTKEQRIIQPLKLQVMDGNWYCSCWDFAKNEFRIFRCDFILSVQVLDKEPLLFTEKELQVLYAKQFQQQRPYSFKVQITDAGIEQFHKRSYDNMSLQTEAAQPYIVGTFGEQEHDFLAHYFLSFGKNIKIIQPQSLKKAYKQLLTELLQNN